MEDYYEYLDSNGVTTLYKLIKDDTVALINEYSVTVNGITTTLDTHINDSDIHTPISVIEGMIDTRISGLVNSAPETLDTLKELSDALGNDPNFATTVANQIGNKADKDTVYTKLETDNLLEDKANSKHTHVVSDITDFPTIPTKLSQLENDMGFGTGGGSGDTTDCVHKTGNETINGVKTFTDKIISNKELHYTDTKYDWSDTSINTWCDAGNVVWFDKTGNRRMHELIGANGGVWKKSCYINESRYLTIDSNKNISYEGISFKFNGKNVAIDENLVHTSGNEYISGIKSFSSVIYLLDNIVNKNNQVDLTVTPTSNLYTHYLFIDKNGKTTAYTQHGKQTSGIDFIGLFVKDKSANLIGVELTTNKEFIPFHNNTYSLGTSSNKWAQVFSSRINCDNIVKAVENSYIYMTAGPSWNNGASIFLNGKSGDGNGSGNGTFTLYARNTTAERYLLGRPDGLLKWTGCIEANEVRSTTANAFMAQNGGYTCTLRNDGSNTYLLMSEKDGAPGTWSSARPLQINNSTGLCSINGNANSAYYSETPATTDNSTRIATTAWVRTYVNSVAGSNTVGSSISAYWSNSSNVTATGQASSGGYHPACYSDYITKTPTVGTIYSGAQLYTVLNTSASATGSTTGSSSGYIYVTNTKAQATFSSPISTTGKYLCTTANTVKFRAYTTAGTSSSVGTSSVVDNTSTKSIFIRVQ